MKSNINDKSIKMKPGNVKIKQKIINITLYKQY